MKNTFDNIEIRPYDKHFDHVLNICRLISCAICENTEKFSDGLNYIIACEEATVTELPLILIKKRFNLNMFEYICVLLATAIETDEVIANALRSISGEYEPTIGLALQLFSTIENVDGDVFINTEHDRPLSYLLQFKHGTMLSKRFKLREEVFRFIMGRLSVNDAHITVMQESNPSPLNLYQDERSKIVHLLSDSSNDRTLVVISAKNGFGRRTLAYDACGEANFGVVFVTPEENMDTDKFDELKKKIVCICVMTNSIPIITPLSPVTENNDVYKLIKSMPLFIKTIILCSNGKDMIMGLPFSTVVISLPSLSREERIRLWNLYGDISEVDKTEVADRYKLSISQITAVNFAVKKHIKITGKSYAELVSEEVEKLNRNIETARIVTPHFESDDLIIDEKSKKLIEQICITMKYRSKLYDETGFGKLFPYGRGLGVLFYGTPGTGKTMAAHVLGRELGLCIMQADLSRIADKYIGETEKHLSEIFEAARESNCILFFDEADSLFSKRTTVSDSHDKHANTQTAHLLQKMEEYDGLVILATNLADNVDEAFKRRLPFAVEFTRPDSVLREKLWRNFIPDDVPKEEIDYTFLGKTFELTPAVIKWAAFSATVRAFSESSNLTMQHITDALSYEYEKSGAVFPDVTPIDIVL